MPRDKKNDGQRNGNDTTRDALYTARALSREETF